MSSTFQTTPYTASQSISADDTLAIAADDMTMLSAMRRYALFLDIDGTLAAFQVDPKASFIPATTLQCLQGLQDAGVPVCLVTGRGVEQARAMAQGLMIPIAGTHGLEIFIPDNLALAHQDNKTMVDGQAITSLHEAVTLACHAYPKLSIEYKPYSVALHFREHPQFADNAEQIMRKIAADYPDWTLKSGKCVWELAPAGANKGAGIMRLLNTLDYHPYCPIFIGDDVTDEAGFDAVNELDGITIKVGEGDTHARYRLADIESVATWLQTLLATVQN